MPIAKTGPSLRTVGRSITSGSCNAAATMGVKPRVHRRDCCLPPRARIVSCENPPMEQLRNRVVQVGRFGGPDGLEVVAAALPTAGRGEVRVRVQRGGTRNLCVCFIGDGTLGEGVVWCSRTS